MISLCSLCPAVAFHPHENRGIEHMKTANFTLPLLLVISGASGFSAFAQSRDGAANWPQWRGPQSAGISEEKNLPTEWGADKNVVWKTALPGRGHSSRAKSFRERRPFITSEEAKHGFIRTASQVTENTP
jgi:hypothetical protein